MIPLISESLRLHSGFVRGAPFVKNMQGNEMIENINSYETIFKRKSIRQYDLTPLDGHTLAEVMARTSTLNPLYDDIKIEVKLL